MADASWRRTERRRERSDERLRDKISVQVDAAGGCCKWRKSFCTSFLLCTVGEGKACELVTEHQWNTDDDQTRKDTILHLSFASSTSRAIQWNYSFSQGEDCLLKPLNEQGLYQMASHCFICITYPACHYSLSSLPLTLWHAEREIFIRLHLWLSLTLWPPMDRFSS